MTKSEDSNKTKIFIVTVATAVVIGILVAMALVTLTTQHLVSESNSSRTVFWRHIHGLGIDPVHRNILYIATHGDFYWSVNDEPPSKIDEQRADYMAFNAPYAQGVPLYASGHPATGGNTGLIKSTDGGKTWQEISDVLDSPIDFHAMAVSKSDPDIIIGFDSAGSGLFKTIDAGINWQKIEFSEYVSALTISPTDSNLVFAGTGNGILVSSDGANTWTTLEQYKGLLIFALSFDEKGTLYASTDSFGLSKSSDLGISWEKIDSPKLTIMSIAVDAQNKVLYIAGYSPDGFQEVYKSSDDGNTWVLIGTNKEL